MTLLTKLPSAGRLLMQAAFKRENRPLIDANIATLPATILKYAAPSIEKKQFNKFHQVTNWQGHALHPCYLHVMSFPLHLMLMLQKKFPFSLLGLVHIANEITQYRPIYADEACVFSCYFRDITPHSKGIVFSIITEIRINGELCWSSESANLYRSAAYSPAQDSTGDTQKRSVTNNQEHKGLDSQHDPLQQRGRDNRQTWKLGRDLGRRYARASGDYNPIHLAKLSAQLFGFKQAIAHGMWSKSRCISALEQLTPEPFKKGFTTNVQFIKPILLPNKLCFSASWNENLAIEKIKVDAHHVKFSLDSEKGNTPHLNGELMAI
ncbi:MaoC/PaaZ C-terminal domain-containing protein [Paraglaciecola sp. L1A13]|uniref:MaoC/PaaZ C-terminal domain-containing protein n=1 Tax=Paraglaciecola sp. L1A13 TaxID=2686359 RepID=UPI00131D0A4F|nr:MaoC/PaaZ C-terminal domain-containing protein [Paraglaciecola sp. L1A13]